MRGPSKPSPLSTLRLFQNKLSVSVQNKTRDPYHLPVSTKEKNTVLKIKPHSSYVTVIKNRRSIENLFVFIFL